MATITSACATTWKDCEESCDTEPAAKKMRPTRSSLKFASICLNPRTPRPTPRRRQAINQAQLFWEFSGDRRSECTTASASLDKPGEDAKSSAPDRAAFLPTARSIQPSAEWQTTLETS